MAILLLLFKQAILAPNKLIGSQHYKRLRRRIIIEFHSPSHFTLTTTQLNPSFQKNFKLLQNDPDTGRIFSQPPLLSFKRDKNLGNFLVRSAFQTSNQAGTFKCARARCKTCPFICNVEKSSGPKRSIKITDHFTCTSTVTLSLLYPRGPLGHLIFSRASGCYANKTSSFLNSAATVKRTFFLFSSY